MTHSHALVQGGLRIARWLLPWVTVVFASATLAYAVNGAIAGHPGVGNRRPHIEVAVSTDEAGGSDVVERSATSSSVPSVEVAGIIMLEQVGQRGVDDHLDPIVTPERGGRGGSHPAEFSTHTSAEPMASTKPLYY